MVLTESLKTKIGWKAKDFSLPDYNNIKHSLESLQIEKGLIVAFICNHCPYVQKIIDRLCSDAEVLKDFGINTVAIMSNDWQKYPDDSPANMKIFADKHDVFFPYLIDEDQKTAKEYGAICTPDFFGFDKSLKLQYRGRIYDPNKELKGESDLLIAMKDIAKSGSTKISQFPSIGCSIKWK